MKLSYIILLFCIIFSATHAEAKPYRTYSLDSGYTRSAYTNRAFWHFGIELEYLGGHLFDSMSSSDSGFENKFINRTTDFLIMAFLWNYAQYPFALANHEMGHYTRVSAVGRQPRFYWGTSTSGRGYSDIFEFYFRGLGTTTSGAAVGAFPAPTSSFVPPEWNEIVVKAGGVNNSFSFSEQIEKDVYLNGGHINQLRAYDKAKSNLYNYAAQTVVGSGEGDIDKLLTAYNNKGFLITRSDLMQGAKNSKLLSSTYWAYTWGIFNYFKNGDTQVHSFEVMNFKLPDISHFLNRDGISYRLSSAYRGDGFHIPFSYEYIYKGNRTSEISVGIVKPDQLSSGEKVKYDLNLILNKNGALSLETQGSVEITHEYLLSLGYNSYSTQTLIGERNANQLSALRTQGHELWLRISKYY